MKKLWLIIAFVVSGCSSVSLVESWKNPDIVVFEAYQVLIVGMTQNEDARDRFESKLKKEFEKRDVEAMRSFDVFDISFTDSQKTEEELDRVEASLLEKGFDAILFTKVTGSENRRSFIDKVSEWDRYQGRFKDDYLEYQGIYYEEGYYEEFTVYNAETSLYCICEGKERALIWRGSIEVSDPKNVEKTIDEYVKLVVLSLEEQDLIFRKETKDELTGL